MICFPLFWSIILKDFLAFTFFVMASNISAPANLQFGYNCKSLLELKNDGVLASVLMALKQVHSMFFDELGGDLAGRDVRQVLKVVCKEVLEGCKIVFSRFFPATRYQDADHHLWKMAEQLGATCMTELDLSVTRADVGTEKSRWAQKESFWSIHGG